MTRRDQCPTCGLALSLCQYEGYHPVDVPEIAADQMLDAVGDLGLDAGAYLRWPWRDLDALYGGMAPGTVHYVVAFSGMGKTTFISSAILRWREQRIMLDVMPLENRPRTFRTYLACQTIGVDPGLMLSGDYLARDDAAELRERVRAAVIAQTNREIVHLLHVHDVPEVNVAALRAAAKRATARGAKALIVDHIDHVSDTDGEKRRSLHEISVAVNRAVLGIAQETGLVMLCMSQANQEALRNTSDHLAKYMPLRDNHVLNGGHKRQVATGMLGLYRPLLPLPSGSDPEAFEEWKETIKLARQGTTTPQTALEPYTMGVNLMKSRNYGGREGNRVSLAWEAGRIVDRALSLVRDDDARKHGIRTNRNVA